MGRKNRHRNQPGANQPAPLGRDWVRLDLVAGDPDNTTTLDTCIVRYRDTKMKIRQWEAKHAILSVKRDSQADSHQVNVDGKTLYNVRYLYTVLPVDSPPTSEPGWVHTYDAGWTLKPKTLAARLVAGRRESALDNDYWDLDDYYWQGTARQHRHVPPALGPVPPVEQVTDIVEPVAGV